MKPGILALAILTVLTAAGGGYWVGHQSSGQQGGATQSAGSSDNLGKKLRKLLYYRNPMGLADTSPTPKKDSMGMDYIAVYEGEEDGEPTSGNQISISTEKVQKLGVKTEIARTRQLDKLVRAAGRVEPDERRTYAISPKFEGYVERLHVNATGQPVTTGQALFEVYSPELASAQREYAIAAQGVQTLGSGTGEADQEAQSGMKQLAASSLSRLKNWDISDEQIRALVKTGNTLRTLTFLSPVSGIVTKKRAVQGMRFMPGEALYEVTDLSTVWVIADVFEQDISAVESASNVRAKVKISAYPDKVFEGVVTYVYPTLTADTRTIPVRVELPNPGGLIKPGMFAQVELPVVTRGPVVTVPISAVLDSGTRQIVLVQAKEGRYEPREVKLGARSDNYVEVLEGVTDGEHVVVTANFLIDAESNLKAAVSSFGQTSKPGVTEVPPEIPKHGTSTGVGHQAQGTVDEIDLKAGTVSISHGPVASLRWPAMTMDFKAANAALLKDLKPGSVITFEFVERGQGEWVVTTIRNRE